MLLQGTEHHTMVSISSFGLSSVEVADIGLSPTVGLSV